MAEQNGQFAVDTSKRTLKQWILGMITLLIGLTIAHLGVTLFLLSALGADPFTVFVEGLSKLLHISIGTCHVGMCIILMVVMAIFTKGYVKPGTIVCAFCGGWIIDLFMWLLGGLVDNESGLVLRGIVLVLGCGILAFGMSIVIRSNSGTGPNDLVAIILSDYVNRKFTIAFRWVRIISDAVFVAAGFLMGGIVGVGTIAAVVLIGPMVQFFLPISGKLIQKCFPSLS